MPGLIVIIGKDKKPPDWLSGITAKNYIPFIKTKVFSSFLKKEYK
jgi:hypothetical protein